MTASPMPADKFWQIIERAAKSDHDPDAHVKALRTVVHDLSPDEIISFEVAFRDSEASSGRLLDERQCCILVRDQDMTKPCADGGANDGDLL